MIRLIDNSYLQSVGACLDGKAQHANQVGTLLRFVGEIVASEQIYFTADEKSVVYPISMKAVESVQAATNDAGFLRFVRPTEENLRAAWEAAGAELAAELSFIMTGTAAGRAPDVDPQFTDNCNPDDRIHSLVISHKLAEKAEDVTQSPVSSNTALGVLTREPLREEIDKMVRRGQWHADVSQTLAIATRILTYETLSEILGATYLPSLGRSELSSTLGLALGRAVPNFLDEFCSLDKPDAAPGLSTVVEALVVVSKGRPHTLLQEAFSLRKDCGALRGKFAKLECGNYGDALILKAKRMSRDYQYIVESLVEGIEPVTLAGCFEMDIAAPGIPSVKIKPGQMEEWAKFKWKKRHVKGIARLIARASRQRSGKVLERLYKRCQG